MVSLHVVLHYDFNVGLIVSLETGGSEAVIVASI